jgi:hypothetical protein
LKKEVKMRNDIIDLESFRKDSIKFYEHTKEVIDNKTGEVVADTHTFSKKVKTKDEFVKLYIENIDFLQTLTNGETKILLYAIKNVNYTNSFSFTSDFMGYFIENNILKKSSVYNGINSLTRKKVFIKATDEMKKEFGLYGSDIYFINPDVVGKGSFSDLKELKRTIVKTFDFENLQMKQEVITETKYTGFSEVIENLDNHEIKQIKSEVSPDGKNRETEILIGEKNNIDVIDVEANIAESKKSDVEIESENLRLKIKVLELEKVNKELENAKLDKEIELTKLQRGTQPSLNFGDDK